MLIEMFLFYYPSHRSRYELTPRTDAFPGEMHIRYY